MPKRKEYPQHIELREIHKKAVSLEAKIEKLQKNKGDMELINDSRVLIGEVNNFMDKTVIEFLQSENRRIQSESKRSRVSPDAILISLVLVMLFGGGFISKAFYSQGKTIGRLEQKIENLDVGLIMEKITWLEQMDLNRMEKENAKRKAK